MAALLLVASADAAAQWTHLGTSESDAQIYVDRKSSRKSGNAVKLWMMEDYKSPRTFAGKTFQSVRMQHEYDCKERKRRVLESHLYSGNKLAGSVVLSSSKATDWRSITPATVAETLWKTACGRK